MLFVVDPFTGLAACMTGCAGIITAYAGLVTVRNRAVKQTREEDALTCEEELEHLRLEYEEVVKAAIEEAQRG